MCYTTIKIHAEQVAALLAQRKIEKKWESLGWSPYIETFDNYIGAKYTEDAEKDYNKHYRYFMEIILSKKINRVENKKEIEI